ncbi:MAG: 16S rRNA processing protein RimM [Bacteroidetes bacterium]|nr:16S rRNA processing protein RimM [Bacteroidota bacterium]
MKNEYFYLGHITKSFGIKGQLSCYFDTDEPEKYADLDAVFIDLDGEKLPYLIENIQYRGANTFVIKFQDVDEEEAKSLIKAELYLPMSELPPLTGNRFYFHEVIGFKVIDEEKGDIGVCRDFIDISHHPIMQIDHEGTEILIPAIDEIFKNVDRENKQIHIAAPEGLIDVYLES